MADWQEKDARDHLLAVLEERGIALNEDDLAWAFESSRTKDELVAWVQEYLQSDNLLTKEELELYRATGPGRSVSAADGITILQDDQLSEALESLRTSTSLIEQHTRVLEKQRDALEALQRQKLAKDGRSGAQTHARLEPTGHATYIHVKDELTMMVQEDLDAAFKQSDKATSALMSLTTERLGADDEVLAALAKLAPRSMPERNLTTTVGQIEKWTRALAVMREQEANARIDTMIDQNILELFSSEADGTLVGEAAQAGQIEAELKSLRDEIGSVVELVVGSDFRQPLLCLLRRREQETRRSQHEWLEYILATMEHMTKQVDEISHFASDIDSYNSTLAQIGDAYIARNVSETSTKSEISKDSDELPVSTLPNRSRAATMQPNANLGEQVFRRFAIQGRPAAATSTAASRYASDRLETHNADLAGSTAEVIAKSIEDQRRELQSVLKQLFVFSQFASTHLLPPDVEVAVQNLDIAIAETAVTLSSAESGKHEDVRKGLAKLRKDNTQPNQ